MSNTSRALRAMLSSAAVIALAHFGVAAAGAASLTWDPNDQPAAPTAGNGTWDTTTSSDWSNGSTDSAWVNGDSAVIDDTMTGYFDQTMTIDDSSGTVDVDGISFTETYSARYLWPQSYVTIDANPGDSLTLTNPALTNAAIPPPDVSPPTIGVTINAPIAGTAGLVNNGLQLTLNGQNTYTGNTEGVFNLGGGAALGNTAISDGMIYAAGNVTAGSTGPGTSGATFADTSYRGAGIFTLQQENSFTGPALILNGSAFFFEGEGTQLAAFDLVGPGTAEVLNSGTAEEIGIESSYLEAGVYTLISVPGGGLDQATWGLLTPTITSPDGSVFNLSLSNTDTAVYLTVMGTGTLPEPMAAALALTAGGILAMRRRRPRNL